MLKVASFKMSDAEGINKLLTEYRLADRAGIFVSNGEVMIPYEDGEPMNNRQRAIALKEDRNKMALQVDVIKHSNVVLETMISQEEERFNTVEADIASAQKNNVKAKIITQMVNTRDAIRAGIEAMKSTIINNQAEIRRNETNIVQFDKKIAELEA